MNDSSQKYVQQAQDSGSPGEQGSIERKVIPVTSFAECAAKIPSPHFPSRLAFFVFNLYMVGVLLVTIVGVLRC